MNTFLSSFPSPATNSEFSCVANVYKQTKHNIAISGLMKNRIIKSDDTNARGKYHTVDTNEWIEVESHIINEKLIGVGREYKYKDAIVYMQIVENGRIELCNNFKQFHKQDFIEYKKERGERKYQDPMISGNGTLWIGNTEGVYDFIVFVPKENYT